MSTATQLHQSVDSAIAAADRSYFNFLERWRAYPQHCWTQADRTAASFALAVTALFKEGRPDWEDGELHTAYTRALWDYTLEFLRFSSGHLDLDYPEPDPPLSLEQTQEQNRIYAILQQRLENPPEFTEGIQHFTD